eukprot:1919381-Karenia_brevis.AAC.1
MCGETRYMKGMLSVMKIRRCDVCIGMEKSLISKINKMRSAGGGINGGGWWSRKILLSRKPAWTNRLS